MKKLLKLSVLLIFFLGIVSITENANASEIHSIDYIESNINQQFSKPDSGFFDKLSKGYRIASNLSLENLGEMANMVIFSKKKNVDAIVNDVSNYLDQLSTANKQIKNIKINKNTKIYVKRDK